MQRIALLIVAHPACQADCYANSLLLDWPASSSSAWSPWGEEGRAEGAGRLPCRGSTGGTTYGGVGSRDVSARYAADLSIIAR
jgi:hypothetical protein